MRIFSAILIALFPFAATAGGHGTFYICEAQGLSQFEIEVAAKDCQVGRAKAKRSGDATAICDFGKKAPGKVTLASDQSVMVEMNGKTFKGMCDLK